MDVALTHNMFSLEYHDLKRGLNLPSIISPCRIDIDEAIRRLMTTRGFLQIFNCGEDGIEKCLQVQLDGTGNIALHRTHEKHHLVSTNVISVEHAIEICTAFARGDFNLLGDVTWRTIKNGSEWRPAHLLPEPRHPEDAAYEEARALCERQERLRNDYWANNKWRKGRTFFSIQRPGVPTFEPDPTLLLQHRGFVWDATPEPSIVFTGTALLFDGAEVSEALIGALHRHRLNQMRVAKSPLLRLLEKSPKPGFDNPFRTYLSKCSVGSGEIEEKGDVLYRLLVDELRNIAKKYKLKGVTEFIEAALSEIGVFSPFDKSFDCNLPSEKHHIVEVYLSTKSAHADLLNRAIDDLILLSSDEILSACYRRFSAPIIDVNEVSIDSLTIGRTERWVGLNYKTLLNYWINNRSLYFSVINKHYHRDATRAKAEAAFLHRAKSISMQEFVEELLANKIITPKIAGGIMELPAASLYEFSLAPNIVRQFRLVGLGEKIRGVIFSHIHQLIKQHAEGGN